MGYRMSVDAGNQYLQRLRQDYRIFAPVAMPGKGAFTDTESIRYQEVARIEEICFDKKSSFSPKEVFMPITQTLFYFTEENWTEPQVRDEKILLFVRSCDIHAISRLDEIYLANGPVDPYYKQLRDKIHYCLMECQESFDNCFCVSMGANRTDEYELFVRREGDDVLVAVKNPDFARFDGQETDVAPRFVERNEIVVTLPEKLSQKVAESDMWQEYTTRCTGCGRCNFVCPTCTCFSMQDIFYQDNAKVGERRRVWASCMVDGYTDMAGGHAFRKTQAERMRFKVFHKVYDYPKRFGRSMCVGCGRCDDACPEYISYSNSLNKLAKANEEVTP